LEDAVRRNVIGLGLVVIMVAGIASTGAAKKAPKPRVMKLPYTAPAYGTHGAGVCFQGESCLFFGEPQGKERFFGVEIEDDLGREVYASVIQDTNEDGNFLVADDLTVGICGKTTESVELEPGKAVSVWVWQGPGIDPPCAGTASAGEATATFSATGSVAAP
ncbi:MAG TPA: hypothetical protein VJ927_05390, partial [Actinomycetota bacterium]|nr:hypothetical protein [Actinomycetota bacterium]